MTSFLTDDGCRIAYAEHGSGEPVVLLHGLGSRKEDWGFQVPALSAHYRVIAPDLRGHGQSSCPTGPYSIGRFATDVEQMLDHLRLPSAHVAGLSLGGMIGFQIAAQRPELLRSLTVVNSGPEVAAHTKQDRKLIRQRRILLRLFSLQQLGGVLAKRLFPHPHQAALREQFLVGLRHQDKRAYRAAFEAIVGWSVLHHVQDITVPTLVVTGDRDYTAVSAKEAFVGMMPNARLAVVADSGHATPLDSPDALNEHLLRFLASTEPARGTADH